MPGEPTNTDQELPIYQYQQLIPQPTAPTTAEPTTKTKTKNL